MKRKIIAIVASILVFSGAGVYAAKSSSAAAKPAPAAATVTVKNTGANAAVSPVKTSTAVSPAKASAAVSNAAKTAAAVQGKTSASSCPTSKAVTVVQKSASSCSGAQKAAASVVSSLKSSCSSAAGAQAAKSCTQGTNCTNAQILCPALTGNSQCAGTNCYQNILCYLTGKGCGQTSAPASSAPASSSKPPVASKPPVSSTPASSGSYSSFQNQVVQLVNQERTSRGLKALTVDSALTNTATLKSQDMAKLGYFDHTSPTYGSPFDMMKQFGISYRAAGENIAYGQTSPAQVMQGWMNSEGHRANILSTSYTKIGVGIAQNSSGRYYWTQQFIG